MPAYLSEIKDDLDLLNLFRGEAHLIVTYENLRIVMNTNPCETLIEELKRRLVDLLELKDINFKLMHGNQELKSDRLLSKYGISPLNSPPQQPIQIKIVEVPKTVLVTDEKK
ncbi:hypothetical protein ACOME3_008537 [Neoechinorhynchus agilis]